MYFLCFLLLLKVSHLGLYLLMLIPFAFASFVVVVVKHSQQVLFYCLMTFFLKKNALERSTFPFFVTNMNKYDRVCVCKL